MAEIFSGDWTIECLWSGLWSKRFIIEGSLASDGVYALGWDGVPMGLNTVNVLTIPPISVSGPRWLIRFEWADAGVGWQPDTSLERSGAAYTLQDGLVVDLVFEVPPGPGLRIGDSASLRCRNVDPKLNPWRPFANSYDFTMPRRR